MAETCICGGMEWLFSWVQPNNMGDVDVPRVNHQPVASLDPQGFGLWLLKAPM